MNAITLKRIWQLVPLARNTICARRAALLMRKTSKISLKSGNASILKPIMPFIQCRFHSSKSDNAHHITLIREWNAIGDELRHQQRWEEALEAVNKVLKIDANNSRALSVKGIACYKLKQFQVALDCIETLLIHGAAAAEHFFVGGLVRCHLDQYDEALECFKQCRKLNQEDNNFWPQVCYEVDDFGPRSIEFILRALKDLPNESVLYYSLSACYIRDGKFAQAKELALRAVEMDPDNGFYLMMLGGIELELENLPQASQILDKSIELGITQGEDIWKWRIEVARQMGNYNEEEKFYYKAFEHIKPGQIILNNALALAKHLHKTFSESERAIKLIEKVISFENSELTSIAERMLADLFVEKNRLDDATVIYRKLHEKMPNDPDITFNYALLLAPKEALPYLEKLSRIAPDDITWEYLGHAYRDLSQYEKGIEAFDKAIAIRETMNRYHTLASCYANLRKHREEYHAMQRVCELASTDEQEETRYFAVWPLVARWQYKRALQEMDEFLKKNPTAFDAWSIRALILQELGREAEALETIEKTINIEPHFAVYVQKADILATFGRFDEAFEVLKHLETLLEQSKRFQDFYDLVVGATLQKQGRYEEALENIDKCINTIPAAPDLFVFQRWTEKAKTLEALKRTDEAIVNYEYVLSIFPQEPYSLLHLAKLYRETGLNSSALALVPRLAALHTDIDSFNNEVSEFLALIK